MRTIVLADPPPADVEALLERRRQTGADRHDEVWDGVLYMAPAPHWRHAQLQGQMIGLLGAAGATRGLLAVGDVKLGEPDDYRVPDAALTPPAGELFNPTAPLVVEILSTGDATQQKLPFDARHGVSEVVIVDPDGRTVRWLALAGRRYEMVERSRLLDLDVRGLVERIAWPS